MLRVVFIILAIATLPLAIVLGQLALYALALVLVATAAYLTTRKLRKAHNDIPESFMKAPMPPEVDLSSLGIVDIRPVTSTATGSKNKIATDLFDSVEFISASDHEDGSEFENVDDEPGLSTVRDDSDVISPADSDDRAPQLPGIGELATAVSRVKTRRSRATILVSQASSRRLTSVLLPAMTSLRASLNAYTVCLLRRDVRPLRFHVEAIVSQNSYARPQGSFALSQPFGSAGSTELISIIPERTGSGVPSDLLGYYYEHIPVEQLAVVEFSGDSQASNYVLIADSMEPGLFDAPQAMQMLQQYGVLIKSILDTETEEETFVQRELDSENGSNLVRPRREIIREEMENARSNDSPLSLALVFLNSGEKMAGATAEEIDIVETEFELRLKAVAVEGVVEHFGELTYGIFFHGPLENVAAWAGNLQSSFARESGLLEGGISVGVAMLGERHDGPDEFRAEATAALREAFDSGECTIVG